MKNLFFMALICLLLSSCAATHWGAVSTSVVDKKIQYVDVAVGVVETEVVFFMGGFQKDALTLEAKRSMIKCRPLSDGEQYQNYTVDFKRSYWPFYTKTKVIMSADVIKFVNDTVTSIYSDNYIKKLGSQAKNDLFAVGDSVVVELNIPGVIVAINNNNSMSIMYESPKHRMNVRKFSNDVVFTTQKSYNNYKVGDFYLLRKYPYEVYGTIYAIGIKELIIRQSDEYKTLTVIDQSVK